MALCLSLDDCANSNLPARLFSEAGHTVVRPAEASIAWEDDEIHLAYAIQNGLVLVTKDPDDFHLLHDQPPNHPGIFGIYQDNNVTKDMSDAEIVAAIGRIESAIPSGHPLAEAFHVLNDWRS